MSDTSRPEIVVGVDGSPASTDALRWAARQAALAGAGLRVITAWTFPNEPTPFGIVPDLPVPPDQLARVQGALERVVDEVLPPPRTLPTTVEVIRGLAEDVLLDAAGDAVLLVLGRTGRTGLARILLGSVTEHCTRSAPCPVVVVNPPATPPVAEGG